MLEFQQTDPEFVECFEKFAFDEVPNEPGQELDEVSRYLSNLAILLGCQGVDAFKAILPRALDGGLTPVMVKEVVYQAVNYIGMGRLYPFIRATNEVFNERGIELPLQPQRTVNDETKLHKGADVLVEIGDPALKDAWKTSAINKWLADNCFGEYYTRTGLDLKQRELITFCYIAAQGGCEPQLSFHSKANLKVGNSREFLSKIIAQNIPFIGYPRSLNARLV